MYNNSIYLYVLIFIILFIIIFQRKSLANPCALIGSFLVGILKHGPGRVVLFWSGAGKLKICNRNSGENMDIVMFHSEGTRKS